MSTSVSLLSLILSEMLLNKELSASKKCFLRQEQNDVILPIPRSSYIRNTFGESEKYDWGGPYPDSMTLCLCTFFVTSLPSLLCSSLSLYFPCFSQMALNSQPFCLSFSSIAILVMSHHRIWLPLFISNFAISLDIWNKFDFHRLKVHGVTAHLTRNKIVSLFRYWGIKKQSQENASLCIRGLHPASNVFQLRGKLGFGEETGSARFCCSCEAHHQMMAVEG